MARQLLSGQRCGSNPPEPLHRCDTTSHRTYSSEVRRLRTGTEAGLAAQELWKRSLPHLEAEVLRFIRGQDQLLRGEDNYFRGQQSPGFMLAFSVFDLK